VLAELRAFSAAPPLRERFHEQLMLALYRMDRQAEALEVYQRVSAQVAEDLGVEPSQRLRDLHEAILRGDPPDELVRGPFGGHSSRQAPAQPVPGRGPGQLPADVASFAGRSDRLAEVLSGLSCNGAGHPPPSTVVVTGVAGVGKTALAVHAAHRLHADYPDGQLYANLHGGSPLARAPEEVLDGFLAGLGADVAMIPHSLDAREAAYRSALSGRRVLIVLDDARDAAQVQPLLPGSAGCATLVTSRMRLADLDGSRLVHLDGLGARDALSLLEHRVGADRLRTDPAAAKAIVTVCAGLPLALTIAGARLASRPSWRIGDLAQRLRPEHDRLDELAYGDLGVRKAFDLSYAALVGRGPQGSVLARALLLLGLWPGGDIGQVAAAELIGTDSRSGETMLESLVDLNLVESPSAGRYRLHDLVRTYALDRASREVGQRERSAATGRIVSWYLCGVDNANEAAERMRRRLDPGQRTAVAPAFANASQAFSWLTG
jgi:hypothetical protein